LDGLAQDAPATAERVADEARELAGEVEVIFCGELFSFLG
jgi:hypothetical protein